MPVTERLEDPGSFSVALNANEVPFDEIQMMKELGQIIITPAWFLHPELFAETDLLAAARYSGVLLEVEWAGDTISLHGQGPWWYLGDANGNGPALGADVTYAAAAVDDILKSIATGGILPPSISAGTITTTGVGTYTGTFYASQTCLSAVRTVLTTLGMHARINPDWTMDACLATRDDVFTVTSPTVVAVKRGFGGDPTYTGIEPETIRNRIDAVRWVSESIIENIDAAGARSILSSSTRSVIPYQDGLGNQLDRAVIQSGPASDDVGFDTFHSQALEAWDTQKEEELTTDQFDFSGAFEVGDWIFVYAPELGFHDEANQIFFRGLALSPIALQVPVDTWPTITPEMGVYYRPSRTNYAEAVLGDGPLAYWRLDEPSGTDAADSAGHTSGPFDGTYTSSPTLNQQGVMQDGSGNASADFSSTAYVAGSDWTVLDFLGTASFSVECWIEYQTGAFGAIVTKGRGYSVSDHDGWSMNIDGSNSVTFIRFDRTVESVVSGSVTPATNHHVVGTFDGTTLRLYVDGTGVDSDTTVVTINDHNVALRIARGDDDGSPSGTANDNYDGTADEVAIYDRVLTGREIAEHYAIGKQGSLAGRWIDLTRYVRSERR